MKQEWRAIIQNRKLLIPVIAVLFIPLLYSGMFLWAFWDPYAHLDELPVAVVNNDKGAVFNGEKLEIGKELVDKLKENKKFAWHFVTEQEAEKGLRDQKYYMAVKIPENFSENATTIQDEHPKRMTLIYMPNESFNFLSAQIGNTAVEKIKEELSHTVTATYAETMLENVKKMADGLHDASDGAKQVHDGVAAAKDGAVQLQNGLRDAKEGSGQLEQGAKDAKNGAAEIYRNLQVLAEKSLAFENGLKSASNGSEQLQTGLGKLDDGFTRMQAGQAQLLDGAKKAENGTKQLSSGLKQSLAGMEQMKEKMPQLTDGTLQVKNGAGNLAASLEQWKQGAESTKTGAIQVSDGLQQVIAQLDAMIAQTTDANKKATLQTLKNNLLPLSEGSKRVAGGVAKLADGASALKTGADQLATGASQLYNGQLALAQGIDQLASGQQKLVAGADVLAVGQGNIVQGLTAFGEKMTEAKAGVAQLASGNRQLTSGLHQLTDGSTKLQNGASQLAAGSGKLASGMTKLEDGISTLSNGVTQLSNGSDQLVDGMKKLDDGSKQLADKLADGAKKANDVKANDEVYRMFSEPVKMKNERIHPVPNYGTGFTPYFLSLGLFVGALLLSIVFPLREPASIPRSGVQWFFSKFGVLAIVGVIQALLADTVLLAGLKLHVQSVPNFIIFSILTSITFIALIQFLVTTLGDPGRFVGIVILILQLTTSAGTFPLELIPKTLQPINHYLPMTYSVFGFKAAISSGDFAFMWKNAAILAVFIIVLSIGTVFYFTVQHKRKFYTMTKQMNEAPEA